MLTSEGEVVDISGDGALFTRVDPSFLRKPWQKKAVATWSEVLPGVLERLNNRSAVKSYEGN